MNSKDIILSISIMCSGRVDTTERCLSSLDNIRKKIKSELIITDTGCDKKTREIIEKYADKIIDFKWCNDFAKARNIGLRASDGKWFMFLDDDEFFEDDQDLIEFFTSGDYVNYGKAFYGIRNYTSLSCDNWSRGDLLRLAKNTDTVHFTGKVHEFLDGTESRGILFKAYVGHMGYAFQTEEARKKHAQRNISLLLELLDEEPEQLRWPYQLLQEYAGIGAFDKVYELSDRYLTETKDMGNHKSSFYCARMVAQRELEMIDELLENYNHGINDPDINDIGKGKMDFLCAKFFYERGEFEKCNKCCKQFIKLNKKYKDDRGLLFIYTGFFLEEVFVPDKESFMQSLYIATLLKLHDFTKIPKVVDEINWKSENLNLCIYLFISIIELSCDIGYQKDIRYIIANIALNEGVANALVDFVEKFRPQMTDEMFEKVRENF